MLNSIQERMRVAIDSILRDRSHAVASVNESFFRFSPAVRLEQLSSAFEELRGRLSQVIKYRLSQNEQLLPNIQRELANGMRFVLSNKSEQVSYMEKRLELSNPKLKSKSGWAEVVHNGKRVELSSIEIGDEIDMVDSSVKIRVKALQKQAL